MIRKPLLIAAAVSALAISGLAANAPAIAAGGSVSGGGGSMPEGRQIDPAARYREGIGFLQQQNYRQAERAFQDVLRVASRDGNSNFMMGLTQVGLEDWGKAQRYFNNAVRYSPDLIEAKGWLGAVEAKLNHADRANDQRTALAALKAAGGAPEQIAKIDEGIARIDAVLADRNFRLSSLEATTRLASNEEGGSAYLAAYGLINEGRYTQALGLLQEAGLAQGPRADILTYQGFANRKLGRYGEAVGYYSAALSIEPNHRGANEYLGEYYVQIGDMGRARAQLAKLDRICRFGCAEAEQLRDHISRGPA
jgi:tetratricopeptide (TPR) repeat protein